MRASCPSCGKKLPWGQLASDFKCPACGTRLASNYWTVLIWVTLLAPTPAVLFRDGWALVIAFVLGVGLWWILIAALTNVRVFDEKDAT